MCILNKSTLETGWTSSFTPIISVPSPISLSIDALSELNGKLDNRMYNAFFSSFFPLNGCYEKSNTSSHASLNMYTWVFPRKKKTFLGRYSSSFNQKLWHLSRPIISVPNRRYTQGRSVLLVLKTYRCNYFARHQYSLVNIYSYRNQEHLHSGLEHDRNMTPTDIRPHLDKKVIICRNKPEKFNVC